MLNVSAYLDRIGYLGQVDPSAETLRGLHLAHMLAVPFENLDIHLGRPIICDEERFLHKIINERRGGFCYELNGAFAALLRALGFNVTLLSAQVAGSDGSSSPEFDHLTLRVAVHDDEPWLADVGFGDSFIEPLRLISKRKQLQAGHVYRLMEDDEVFHLESRVKDQWKKQYSFTLRPRQLGEFAGRCQYHQTSPDSHFTRQRICSLATPEGRVTLSDLKLIETREGRKEERMLTGDGEWRTVLQERFGLTLPAS